MNYKTLGFALTLMMLASGCNSGELTQNDEAPDATLPADVGHGDTLDAPAVGDALGDDSASADVRDADAGRVDTDTTAADADTATMDADSSTSDASDVSEPEPCDLNDNSPDDCYDVAPLNRGNTQRIAKVRSSTMPSWECEADRTRYVFEKDCIKEGIFPNGSWRHVLFEKGKILSIEVLDPTQLSGKIQLVQDDSGGWAGTGKYGNYKITLSRLPGDFSDKLPDVCRTYSIGSSHQEIHVENREGATSSEACWLDADKTYYLNIRATSCGTAPAGESYTHCSHTFWAPGADAGW